ncbi:7366_t:CDS:2 [Paraglomus occultum]|uniref:7366_t:CDS:1 n=1 Tax=Paraglomus occultum TaxID=144539 RepID=A0A9N9GMM4_9GLOM|nr:7366_t:CDS:2 [Paraglomus occultum]
MSSIIMLTLADIFLQGLPYVEPQPLLYTDGLHWEYQPGPDLHHILHCELERHYEKHCLGSRDKGDLPIYLFLSRAGTGKSRHATEFHQTVIKCLGINNEKLKNKLQNAWVFHVSLENGTVLGAKEQQYPFEAIGSRMLLQLLPEKSLKHITESYEAPDKLDHAVHCADLRSISKEPITGQYGVIDVQKHKHIILNAKDLGSGDVFCSLDTQSPSNEIQQFKLYLQQSRVTQMLFDKEKIHGRNWADYFGIFAGSIFITNNMSMNINTASNICLQLFVRKIKDADNILLERNKRPFENVEDAMKRTNIPERILKKFRY